MRCAAVPFLFSLAADNRCNSFHDRCSFLTYRQYLCPHAGGWGQCPGLPLPAHPLREEEEFCKGKEESNEEAPG